MAGSHSNNYTPEPPENNNWEALLPANFYDKELRQQAKAIFKLGYGLTAGGAIIVLANILLFLSGNVSAATAMTAGGLASGAIVHGCNLCKDANRLENAAKAGEEEVE